ncbi:MAG: 16S rRNA (cytidine(1402)-2'-O)-methyltransferase [Bacteroidales bacterium]|nr:MAG: 16S rRNA (cytidine(1402)-2'-O)-methyltransferase [Bacteroidales bacterium]
MSKLFIVPTPIGNLEDITIRSLKILEQVDLIIAEDTRKTGHLLKHYKITTRLRSHHKFNEHYIVSHIVTRIKNGKSIALVTDAGTPSISDPGYLLIRTCLENDIDLECLPGPTAFIPALVISGLPDDKFCFEGFLNVKKGRQKRLKELTNETRTIVFYESPHRLLRTLNQFVEYFGPDRKASISRELTKIHEETIRGSLSELVEHYSKKTVKGEIVIVLGPKS